MTEGSLAAWLVADGATVEAGHGLYILETDKVETEISAPVSGTLRIIGVTGETYEVGTVIGAIE